MRNTRLYLLANIVLGATLTFGYAPFSFWWLVPAALVAVFWLMQHAQTPKQAGWFGFSFGLGWFGAGVSWVHVSIADFGGLPLMGSLGLMALLVGYLALFPALAFYLTHRVVPATIMPYGLAAIWFLVEWLRSWFLTGFPWLSLGYSQIGGAYTGWFPVVGETGVSVLLVVSAALIARYLKALKYIPGQAAKHVLPAIAIVALGSLLQLVPFSKDSSEQVKVAMVQGNIEQELRWVPEQDIPTMKKYLHMTRKLWDHELIIWPEAAVPRLEPLANDYLLQVDDEAFSANVGLVTGIVNYNFETTEAHNNLIVLGRQDAQQKKPEYRYLHANRYAKHHLLPIGEFIPMESWLRGLAPIFDLPMSSFSRGDYEQSNLLVNGHHLVSAICFEIAFPRQIRANLRQDSDFILTVSNDAWFGQSHGPAQHLEIAQVRAAEFGMPVMRATNNGITAFIDRKGEIQARAPQFQEATLSFDMVKAKGTTPYRWYGDLPLWLYTTIVGLALIFFRLRPAG